MSRYHSHSKRDCRVRCEGEVDVDVDFKPKVVCIPKSRRKPAFDVEVDIKVDPKCKLTPKHSYHDKKGCKTVCVFGVELDFDCDARAVCTPCDKGHASFDVKVEVDTKTKCDARRRKHSSYEEEECEKHEEREEREERGKRRRHRRRRKRSHEKREKHSKKSYSEGYEDSSDYGYESDEFYW